ncbi:hypothetical protein [Nonomuraea sp. NPDC049684]|uniref:hypothetical protein n=1 Tax=Nonomuraea sp. NPDC049684 TaxID=3364356 RepID=UPI0037B703FF
MAAILAVIVQLRDPVALAGVPGQVERLGHGGLGVVVPSRHQVGVRERVQGDRERPGQALVSAADHVGGGQLAHGPVVAKVERGSGDEDAGEGVVRRFGAGLLHQGRQGGQRGGVVLLEQPCQGAHGLGRTAGEGAREPGDAP